MIYLIVNYSLLILLIGHISWIVDRAEASDFFTLDTEEKIINPNMSNSHVLSLPSYKFYYGWFMQYWICIITLMMALMKCLFFAGCSSNWSERYCWSVIGFGFCWISEDGMCIQWLFLSSTIIVQWKLVF